MTGLRDLIAPERLELPTATVARWASILFSLSVLTFLLSIAAAQAFLAAASIFYAIHLLQDRPAIAFPPVKLALALFCLTTLVSLARAADPAVSWFAVRKLVLFLILLLAVNLVQSAGHLVALYRGLFIESAVAGLVGAAQFVRQYRSVRALHPDRVYFYMTAERIRGFMGHWMNFGGQQLLVYSALAAFLLLGARRARGPSGLLLPTPRFRLLWWTLGGVIAASIVLNFTRGVWLGCFVATVYLVARVRPRWLWVLPALVVVGYAAAPGLVRHRLNSLRHPSDDPSLAIRFEMWQVGLRMIETHPWVGVGPDNVMEVYTQYLAPGKPAVLGYHEHLHNDYFQFAAERGLPNLVAWLWLMAALLRGAWRIRRVRAARRPEADSGLLWIVEAAIAAWLAFMVEGCFEFNFGTSPVLMTFLFIASTPFVVERIAKQRTRLN